MLDKACKKRYGSKHAVSGIMGETYSEMQKDASKRHKKKVTKCKIIIGKTQKRGKVQCGKEADGKNILGTGHFIR